MATLMVCPGCGEASNTYFDAGEGGRDVVASNVTLSLCACIMFSYVWLCNHLFSYVMLSMVTLPFFENVRVHVCVRV